MGTYCGTVMDGLYPDARNALVDALHARLHELANIADPDVTDLGKGVRAAAQALVWNTNPLTPEYRVVAFTAWEVAHIWENRLRRDGVIP